MANPELGAKQICPACQAKFYDLNKRPAHCPKCGAEFDPDEAVRSRRVRARATTPEPDEDDTVASQTRGASGDDEDEEEDVGAPELDEVVDEPLAGDDEDEDGVEPGAGAGAEDLGEFSDEDVEDDADVPFLEEDEDDGFDESDIEGLPNEDDREV